MDFISKIAERFPSKKALADALGLDPRAFYSLERATDRISIKHIKALRHLDGMTDKRLLDLLEQEADLEEKKMKRPTALLK